MAKKRFISTREAAKRLGVKVSWLSGAVWKGWIREPMRGPGNAFFWIEKDLKRAEEFLAEKRVG